MLPFPLCSRNRCLAHKPWGDAYYANNSYFTVINGIPTRLDPQLGGYILEAQALQAAGIDPNSVKVASRLDDGTLINVIPDAIGKPGNPVIPTGVVEAKFYKATELTLTSQIEGEINYARERGQPFTLIVDPNTRINTSLLIGMQEVGPIIVYDPANNSLTPYTGK